MALSLAEAKADAPLRERFAAVRSVSEALCAPLRREDMVVQSMPDVSPTKWHLAHVSWFFETFLLKPLLGGYRAFHPAYEVLFNSYYNSVGEQFPRHRRGLVTRPGVEEVLEYRRHVDQHMQQLFETDLDRAARSVIEVGLHHEMQHQELLLMDILHVLAQNPLRPAYLAEPLAPAAPPGAMAFRPVRGGVVEIGHGGDGFCFDNERPRHKAYLEDYELGARLATNGEYLEFMRDGGYDSPLLWLADGWARIQHEGWRAPEYWFELDGGWHEFGLHGAAPLDLASPVCHLSFYEADAFATWSKARLPTEVEWEHAARDVPVRGQFLNDTRLRAGRSEDASGLAQVFGGVWEWTASPYCAYPGFEAAPGALGEYNGKFMSNQMVLRGGACVTPPGHTRATYRNFYYPHQRWMFSGLRLARSLPS